MASSLVNFTFTFTLLLLLFIYLFIYEGRTGRPGVQDHEFTRRKRHGKRIPLAELYKYGYMSSSLFISNPIPNGYSVTDKESNKRALWNGIISNPVSLAATVGEFLKKI